MWDEPRGFGTVVVGEELIQLEKFLIYSTRLPIQALYNKVQGPSKRTKKSKNYTDTRQIQSSLNRVTRNIHRELRSELKNTLKPIPTISNGLSLLTSNYSFMNNKLQCYTLT